VKTVLFYESAEDVAAKARARLVNDFSRRI
jgi:hypothetical protein